MTDTVENKPWYKHPWLWFLIAIPVVSVTLSFTMLFVAINHKDSEVEGDWRKNKKAIQENFHRETYASALSIHALLSINNNQLSIKISSPYPLDKEALPKQLNVVFSHPTHENKDVRFVLNQQSNGDYQASITQAISGRYYLDINTSVWRLKETVEMPLVAPLTIKPLALDI
jgi:hypothetical protein